MYDKIFEKYEAVKSNLIYILHDIQDQHPQHYISEEAVAAVSNYLNVPESHIFGVLTFYTMYSTKPRGKNIIRLCESPPCWLKGSDAVHKTLKDYLGVKTGETTQDGEFTLELCACLGVCGNAPVMMVNEDVYGDLTPDRVKKIIDEIRGGE